LFNDHGCGYPVFGQINHKLAILNMSQESRAFCLSAVAYLKVEEPLSGHPVMELPQSESPVIRVLGHRLLAAYLVDEGESFAYVQHRHLAEADMSMEELHAIAVQNLAALAEERAQVRPYGNIYAVLMGGNFEASLLPFKNFGQSGTRT
jgi:hypothetical protein